MLEDNYIMWLSRIGGLSTKKKWDILEQRNLKNQI